VGRGGAATCNEVLIPEASPFSPGGIPPSSSTPSTQRATMGCKQSKVADPVVEPTLEPVVVAEAAPVSFSDTQPLPADATVEEEVKEEVQEDSVVESAVDEAPASAAPVSAVSVSATPVSAAPVSAAPVSAAPVSAAPVSAAPVSAAPVSAAPVSAAPVSAAPVPAAPVSAAPVSSAPVSAAPVSAAPVSAAPVSAAPASAASIPSAPVSTSPSSAAPESEELAAVVEADNNEEESPKEEEPQVEVTEPAPVSEKPVVDETSNQTESVLTFKSEGVSFSKGIAFYNFEGTNPADPATTVKISKRYSEFKVLYADISNIMASENNVPPSQTDKFETYPALPALPKGNPTTLLRGRSNKKITQEREAQFGKILNAIARHPIAFQSAKFTAFLA
jgi:hypothetical protein